MGDLIRLSMLMVRRNKLPILIVFAQFLIAFLLLMVSLSMLWDYNRQTHVLKESMGENVWVLYASVKDSQKYLQDKKAFPSLWEAPQIAGIKERFGDKVQYAYVNMNDVNSIPTPGFRVMQISPELFNHISKAFKRDGSDYLYTNKYHPEARELAYNGKIIRLDTGLKVPESMYKSLFIPSYSGTDFLLVPSAEPIETVNKKDNNFTLFLYQLPLKEIAASGVLETIPAQNDSIRYELRSPTEYTSENVATFRTISKIILVFTVSMLFVFFPGVIGFILLQFEKERGKLALYVAFGATKRNVSLLLLNWNMVLLGIPFFASVMAFEFLSRKLLHTDYGGMAMLTGAAVCLGLILISIVPLMRMSTENMLIQELKGDL